MKGYPLIADKLGSMSALAAVVCTLGLFQAEPADTYSLEIGVPGKVLAKRGLTSTATGQPASLADVVMAAKPYNFLLIGESHDNANHHKMQAEIIAALAASGRTVLVGFEMFTRPNQPNLNGWTLGWWTEEEFIQRSNWKTEWGFDYALYRPIFETVKQYKLPMIALNAPRDWVRAVGRGGPGALTPEQQAQFPPIDVTNKNHRAVINSMMGGHPMTGTSGENMYAAQVLWDTAMADSALKAWRGRGGKANDIVVILAGSGHVMYGQAINYRIRQQSNRSSLSVVGIEEADRPVSRGIGDFIYAMPKGSQ